MCDAVQHAPLGTVRGPVVDREDVAKTACFPLITAFYSKMFHLQQEY